jgi:hypothetical protein
MPLFQAGPDGAVSGSLWACRETFVAIIVTNLPIIHPLLRQLARVTGLGSLLSKNSKSRSRSTSYQLQSNVGIENRKNKSRGSHAHPLSIPNETAWASDEHILPVNNREKLSSKGGNAIVVAQEVSVKSEVADERSPSPKSGRLRGDDWGVSNTTAVGGNNPHSNI